MNIPTVETDRILLRAFAPDDLDDLAPILADPDVVRHLAGGKPFTREQVAGAIGRINAYWEKHGFGLMALVPKESGRVAGWCGLTLLDTTPEIELVYMLAKSEWGKGLAAEAARGMLRLGFGKIGLERIVAVARHENPASYRVMEKIGMRYERDARFYDLDMVYYSITPETMPEYPGSSIIHEHPGTAGSIGG
ncbi:MAG: GNAT family N-acetyltransferase [Candidatus Kapaibacterium sp.]